jgi:hypothetical protein
MSITSRPTLRSPERRLLFAVPEPSVQDFAGLLDAYGASGVEVELLRYRDIAAAARAVAAPDESLDAVVFAAPSRFAPGTWLRGPFVRTSSGRRVPTGWIPVRDAASSRRFASAAARVHVRSRQRTTVAVLGQWLPQYLRLADRIETLLPARIPTFRWTGDVIGRDALTRALGAGVGVGLYIGHGRPIGWAGYHGVRAHHFDAFAGEPLGGLISLCCLTASRRRTGLSYAEALPLHGVTAAAFGAVTDTRHSDNTRWAIGICESLAGGAATIGDLLVRSAPPGPAAAAAYRLIGDPLAPLASANASVRRAAAVVTHP